MRLIESQEECQDIAKYLQRSERDQSAVSGLCWCPGKEVEGSGGHISGARCLPTQQCRVTGAAAVPRGATNQLPTPSSLFVAL